MKHGHPVSFQRLNQSIRFPDGLQIRLDSRGTCPKTEALAGVSLSLSRGERAGTVTLTECSTWDRYVLRLNKDAPATPAALATLTIEERAPRSHAISWGDPLRMDLGDTARAPDGLQLTLDHLARHCDGVGFIHLAVRKSDRHHDLGLSTLPEMVGTYVAPLWSDYRITLLTFETLAQRPFLRVRLLVEKPEGSVLRFRYQQPISLWLKQAARGPDDLLITFTSMVHEDGEQGSANTLHLGLRHRGSRLEKSLIFVDEKEVTFTWKTFEIKVSLEGGLQDPRARIVVSAP